MDPLHQIPSQNSISSARTAGIAGCAALLLLGIALANYFFVKDIDGAYSRLISAEISQRKALQGIQRESGGMQRLLLNILLADTPDEVSQLRKQILDAAVSIDKCYRRLESLNATDRGRKLLSRLSNASLAYRQSCASFLVLVDSDRRIEAIAFNKKELYPLMHDYQKAQESVADYIDSLATAHSSNLTAKASMVGWVTVGASALPVMGWAGAGMVLAWPLFWLLRRPRRS